MLLCTYMVPLIFFFRKKTTNLINMCCKQPFLQPALNYADYSLANEPAFINVCDTCVMFWSSFSIISTISVLIFRDILMLDQIFLSPQVKQSVIINDKHSIYELSHELPNKLRLKVLNN